MGSIINVDHGGVAPQLNASEVNLNVKPLTDAVEQIAKAQHILRETLEELGQDQTSALVQALDRIGDKMLFPAPSRQAPAVGTESSGQPVVVNVSPEITVPKDAVKVNIDVAESKVGVYVQIPKPLAWILVGTVGLPLWAVAVLQLLKYLGG